MYMYINIILYIVQIVEFSRSGNAITFLAFINKFSLTRVVIIKFNCYKKISKYFDTLLLNLHQAFTFLDNKVSMKEF